MRVTALILVAASLAPALARSHVQGSPGQGAATSPPGPRLTPATLAALEAAIADVEAGRRTTPFIGEPAASGARTVTFLARRGRGGIPRIVSDATGWGDRPDDTFDFTAGTMTRAGKGDWYFLEAGVAPRARIEYLVAHGAGDYAIDPYNPRRQDWHGGGPASEFVMPDYVPPPALEGPPPVPAGRVDEVVIESRALGGSRRAIVYTPPGYREDAAYPAAVFHEGRNVAERGAPHVLDWLTARGEMEPIVAAFVESSSPGATTSPTPAMETFLAAEVPAWLATHYAVTPDPGKRAILGISARAKAAIEAATVSPGGFGRVGLIIPGRLLRGEDISGAAARCRQRLHVCILAGQYDFSNLPTARRLRDVLGAAGHRVDYIEVPEGHNPTTWRNHLSEVFASLFPGGRASQVLG